MENTANLWGEFKPKMLAAEACEPLHLSEAFSIRNIKAVSY